MTVYTFWEPREKIPYYVQLCMKTWEKFLPNTEIVLLDYKNLHEYIDVDELGENLFSGRFRMALIADAIRIALLAKHGNVWMDADTIVLSSDVEKYFQPDEQNRTVFFGNHIAFINAPPRSKLMNHWLEFIKERIRTLTPETKIDSFFLGNNFLTPYVKANADEIRKINRSLIMPELKLKKEDEKLTLQIRHDYYVRYYFLQNHHLADVDCDMLLLHNSWTPKMYRDFSPEEFLRCDCTMTNVLAEALDITLPPSHERFQFKSGNRRWSVTLNDMPPKA